MASLNQPLELVTPLSQLVAIGGWPALLPSEILTKIEAVFLKAAGSYWSSPGLAGVEGVQTRKSPDAMRWAFHQIAAILFDTGRLTQDRLDDISLLVWEQAIRGDWCHFDEETRQEFRQQRNHADVWSDQEALFRAEIARWSGRLLEAAASSTDPQRFAREQALDQLQEKLKIDTRENLANQLRFDPSALRAAVRDDPKHGGPSAKKKLLLELRKQGIDPSGWQ